MSARATILTRKIRIDRDDADFVDIIHTDAGDFDIDEFMSVLGRVFRNNTQLFP